MMEKEEVKFELIVLDPTGTAPQPVIQCKTSLKMSLIVSEILMLLVSENCF